jgi:hypothetical protein
MSAIQNTTSTFVIIYWMGVSLSVCYIILVGVFPSMFCLWGLDSEYIKKEQNGNLHDSWGHPMVPSNFFWHDTHTSFCLPFCWHFCSLYQSCQCIILFSDLIHTQGGGSDVPCSHFITNSVSRIVGCARNWVWYVCSFQSFDNFLQSAETSTVDLFW